MISMPSTPTYTSHTNNLPPPSITWKVSLFPLQIYWTQIHFKNISTYTSIYVSPQTTPWTSLKQSIIKGECIRYIRTNTTYETYAAMAHTFKARLRKRNYPNTLINNMIATVKYSDRQQYLQNRQPKQPTMTPPLYIHTPPPQYRLLKQLVLHDYHTVRFKTPRFITLRHPILQSMLVRSHQSFTNDQLVDVILTLNTTASQEHKETIQTHLLTTWLQQ